MHAKNAIIAIAVIGAILACSDQVAPPNDILEGIHEHLTSIESTTQRTGDASAGRDYLIYGDYVDSGIPRGTFDAILGTMVEANNELERSGRNAEIPFGYTAIDAANGVEVVAPNCLQCHAGFVNGQFVLGLGNTQFDFTINQSVGASFFDLLVQNTYGANSPEWWAYEPFGRAVKATGGHLVTEVVGANPADKLAAVLAAHRDRHDLTWQEEAMLPIPDGVVPADVPAWWLLKKKNAMFTTAVGRGDFARMMMASSLLTMQDSSRARIVDERFADVLAFIESLEAPAYPGTVNSTRAERGEVLFVEHCGTCHGRYGSDAFYPNVLVDLAVLQTDSLLSISNYAYDEFVDWYNTSWFSKGAHSARLAPARGYVAPPLDGIWATAPYFHNGSVPTVDDVLNSTNRPSYWRRHLGDDEYDLSRLGWKYDRETDQTDKYTYDTTLPGYGNGGHTFGDHLSDEERGDVIEYLKTL